MPSPRLLRLLALSCLAAPTLAQAPIVQGVQREWQTVELVFSAPFAFSELDLLNPFLSYRFNVLFTRPDGSQLLVPGFFDADGKSANTSADSGNKWRVRLTPDQAGTWSWLASFRTAPNIAVELDFDTAGVPVDGSFHGTSGTLSIGPFDPQALGHRARGMLRPRGKHYLKFSESQEDFLKGGANSPENLLAYYEFDNTWDVGGESPATPDGLHHFDAHLADFSFSDPQDVASLWQTSKGRRIIGAINYLAKQGVDALYFVTYTTDGGDSQDTWPWREPFGPNHKLVYDVSKLAQWEKVFTHMSARGVVMHLVTQEMENDQTMGGLSIERMVYFRELVARFAHHQGLVWNIGEENTSPPADQIAFADYLRAQDPWDHPLTVHNRVGLAYETYQALWGTSFDTTSLQASPPYFNELARNLRVLSSAAGSPFTVFADEAFTPSVAPSMSNLAEMRSLALWGNLMGGGAGIEWYFDFADTTLEDFRVAEPLWGDTRHALEFFRNHVYVNALKPLDGTTLETDDHVLRELGQTYVIYRPNGGGALLLVPDLEPYTVEWFDPRAGGALQESASRLVTAALVINGSFVLPTGPPPYSPDEDWVILVRKAANRAPLLTEFRVAPDPVSRGGPLVVRIRARDPDGPDDIVDVGMTHVNPSSLLATTMATPLGGDLFTISRASATTLELGTWGTLAAVSDRQGALATVPGSFVVVP